MRTVRVDAFFIRHYFLSDSFALINRQSQRTKLDLIPQQKVFEFFGVALFFFSIAIIFGINDRRQFFAFTVDRVLEPFLVRVASVLGEFIGEQLQRHLVGLDHAEIKKVDLLCDGFNYGIELRIGNANSNIVFHRIARRFKRTVLADFSGFFL
jgi:hypothetical protein